MNFMQSDIRLDDWWEIDGRDGITFVQFDTYKLDVPFNVVFTEGEIFNELLGGLTDYYEGDGVTSFEKRFGYGARLSAPGYLDCTSWSLHKTRAEAEEFLNDMYGEEE